MQEFLSAVSLVFLLVYPADILATDFYHGDTAIYYSHPASAPRPNVLFIIDNNSSMASPVHSAAYDPGKVYPGSYAPWSIYKLTSQENYPQHINDPNKDPQLTYISCAQARKALLNYGSYSAEKEDRLMPDGHCGPGTTGTVYLGNFLNFNERAAIQEGPDRTEAAGTTQIDIIRSAVKLAAGGAKKKINIGLMTFASNSKGGQLVTPVQDLSNSAAFESKFIGRLPGAPGTLIPDNTRPLAEALMDAQFYFDMNRTLSTSPISGQAFADSPITETCQKNILVIISNGDSVGDNDKYLCETLSRAGRIDPSTTHGDYDGDNHPGDFCSANAYGNGTHLLDDAAKYAYDTDLSATLDNTPTRQRLETHILLTYSPHKDLLQAAAEKGHGSYHLAHNANQLSQALTNIFSDLLLETDSTLVSPSVPTSPENRTYTGQHVYLGFFHPRNGQPWQGNLKKFGISSTGAIIDKTGALATESNGAFKDDAIHGDFTASSFWSTEDAGRVTAGGVGDILLQRGFSNDTDFQTALDDEAENPLSFPSRNIYTHLTSTNSSVAVADESTELTNLKNRFYTGNPHIEFNTTLGLFDRNDKNRLIEYVHGLDSYDDDGDGDTADLRGDDPLTTSGEEWILGDILHSKPLVVKYSQYKYTQTNEADCSINKSTIFVGANDGMLHAFRTCDGQERWAFIPPELLPKLQFLRGPNHLNYVDGTPAPYIYDADNDGHIEEAKGDRVVLLFGLRRGGNSYYALDVTAPETPAFLWSIEQDNYPELGESWSTPQIGRVKTSSAGTKVVAFIGAGYDNLSEDGRFGATQNFTGSYLGNSLVSAGAVTSTLSTPIHLQGKGSASSCTTGRGVFAFEIATLNSNGVPTFATSANRVWSILYNSTADEPHTPELAFSFPSDLTILDSDNDNHIDRLYAGDTGGQLWRFSQPDNNIDINLIDGTTGSAGWSAERIFQANTGFDGTTGRKIFYRPSVTLQADGRTNLYFGTGDRAHPLNTAVVDRLYAVYDRGQTTASATDEDNLVNVTENLLQENSTTTSERLALLHELYAETNFGWFIELNETERSGEKVLAPALTFNKVNYQTTFTPNRTTADPCQPGNLGTSRLYALDYLTGEAVLNLSSANDSSATRDNPRARNEEGDVLRRDDRVKTLGVGIPSGAVVAMPAGGDTKLLIGCGGSICAVNPAIGGTIYPIYWRPY